MKSFNITVNLSDEFCSSVLIIAYQGGINYWATPFRTVADDTESVEVRPDGENWHKISRETIVDGVKRAFETEGLDLHQSNADRIRVAALRNDAGMVDAEVADWIVQIGIFGKVIYG